MTAPPQEHTHHVPPDALRQSWTWGVPVVALCGYVWVPTGLEPRRPLCPVCEERAFGDSKNETSGYPHA